MKINKNFAALKPSYLFTEIVARTSAYQQAHPEAKILKMGVGDVRGPMASSVLRALHEAVDDQATRDRFAGYGLEQGETWLRERIAAWKYARRGIELSAAEVFISDGAGSDLGNLSDLFTTENHVAITDPVYPAYLDTSLMAGRTISLLPAIAENGFAPMPKNTDEFDIIYLCSPGNPTGAAMTKQQLQTWVDYANAQDAIIIYDAAYEAFIDDSLCGDIPHSIYECEGAKTCAIEVCSFSKVAGFTGVRCGYTIVPKQLVREGMNLNAMWLRRQCTKFNGASILSQRGAMAVLTEEGEAEVMSRVQEYRENARRLRLALQDMSIEAYGADHSPYVWCRVPAGYTSWSYFDYLLDHYHLVVTPGAGFGPSGEGWVRLTGFASTEVIQQAIKRLARKISSLMLILFVCMLVGCGPHKPTVAELREQKRLEKLERDSIEAEQRLRTVQFCDSMQAALQPQVEAQLAKFRYEKNERYEDHGHYVHPMMRTESNAERCYLQPYVSDDLKITIRSYYYGARAIRHDALRLKADSVELRLEGSSYSFDATASDGSGMAKHEIMTLREAEAKQLLSFVDAFCTSRIKVVLEGDRSYTYYLSEPDKKALLDTYQLEVLMQDIALITDMRNQATK